MLTARRLQAGGCVLRPYEYLEMAGGMTKAIRPTRLTSDLDRRVKIRMLMGV